LRPAYCLFAAGLRCIFVLLHVSFISKSDGND
jgi:hypothetical protein